jgi:acetyl esterase/lipase
MTAASTPSSQELDGEGAWDRTSNVIAWTALLGAARGGPDVLPYAAPARATDLTGLPAAFIDVGSVETFRDEAIDYAARLSQAGVPAELHLWPGGFHGFDGIAPHTALAQASRATRLGSNEFCGCVSPTSYTSTPGTMRVRSVSVYDS